MDGLNTYLITQSLSNESIENAACPFERQQPYIISRQTKITKIEVQCRSLTDRDKLLTKIVVRCKSIIGDDDTNKQ